MAERRMFSKVIINSARFLRMPATSRLLYYDLGMAADDDGIVEAFTVIRTTGSSEDDLNTLASKGFLRILNEDSVTHILDWKTNNMIKKDRYKASVYAHLLDEDNRPTASGTNLEPVWNPSGTQMEPQVRLGKDSIGEDSINTSSDEDAPPLKEPSSIDYPAVMDAFNRICTSLPKIKKMDDRRKKALKRSIKEIEEAGGVAALFERVESSDFLTGRENGWGGCGFDWILKPANLTKILEGNYDNRGTASTTPDYTDPNRYKNTSWEE